MRKPTARATDNRLIINVLLLSLTFFVLLNFYFVYQMRGGFKATASLTALPKIEMIILTTPDCTDCASLDSLAESVRNRAVNITEETTIPWTTPAARKMIDEYRITRVPNIIIKGDTNTLFIDSFWHRGDALIVDNTLPPFVDPQSGEVKGRVEMTLIIPENCPVCFKIDSSAAQIKGAITIKETKTLGLSDPLAKELIKKYAITGAPALILSGDAQFYPIINRTWNRIGTWEKDGSLVLRSVPPPFVLTDTGATKGLATATYLTDKSCQECYNLSVHRDVLSQLGIVVENTKNVDISSDEGRMLVSRYNITGIPTLLLSKEAGMYPLFVQVWPQVGTEENDGQYVFRDFEALGKATWKELPAGNIHK